MLLVVRCGAGNYQLRTPTEGFSAATCFSQIHTVLQNRAYIDSNARTSRPKLGRNELKFAKLSRRLFTPCSLVFLAVSLKFPLRYVVQTQKHTRDILLSDVNGTMQVVSLDGIAINSQCDSEI